MTSTTEQAMTASVTLTLDEWAQVHGYLRRALINEPKDDAVLELDAILKAIAVAYHSARVTALEAQIAANR